MLKPSASGSAGADEGTPYTLNLAATSSAGNNAINAWSVAWGDQSEDEIGGNPPSVNHTYATAGSINTINATAHGGGRDYPAAPLDVLVHDLPASIATVVDLTVDAGSPLDLSTTFTDPGTGQTHTATINWGDGTIGTTAHGVTLTESGHAGTVTSRHVYAAHGTYTAYLQIADSGGAVSSIPITSLVNYVAPTFGVTAQPSSVTVGDATTLALSPAIRACRPGRIGTASRRRQTS